MKVNNVEPTVNYYRRGKTLYYYLTPIELKEVTNILGKLSNNDCTRLGINPKIAGILYNKFCIMRNDDEVQR